MNKVWLSLVDSVIMALVTKRYAVTQFMAQVRTLFYFSDVMRFKSAICPAMLAFIAVTLQYSGFPFQIFGAAPALILTITLAFGYALAFDTAISSIVNLTRSPIEHHRSGASKFFRANFASEEFCSCKSSAFTTAIHRPANMGRGALYFLAAVPAINRNLLRLIERRAFARAESFLLIRVPIPIMLFRDDITASFAML